MSEADTSSARSEFLESFEAGFGYANGAFNAGEIDTAFAAIPEGIEFHPPPQVNEGPFHGRDSWRQFVDRMLEEHGQWRVEPREFTEPRRDVILIRTEVGGGPSLPVTGEVWQVWDFEDGIASRIREFTDPQQALAAAGEEPR